MHSGESKLGRAYRYIYEALCGRHPDVLPWHFQWLDGFYLYRSLRKILPSLGGKVLDVGCGKKPYQKLFGSIEEYVGLDVIAGPMVDVVVQPYERWPFNDDYFDVVLLTQVLEHAENLSQLLVETKRVVNTGGVIVASFPFIYNEHGIPDDYWRISAYGGQRLFPDVTLLKIERQGGIGSTIALLLLHWWEDTLNLNFLSRLIKGLILPLNLVAAVVLNIAGLLLDQLDKTEHFYNNVLIVYRKGHKA